MCGDHSATYCTTSLQGTPFIAPCKYVRWGHGWHAIVWLSTTYRIVGNFGEVFNLVISPLYKSANNIFHVYDVMTSSAVAKFNIRQYVLGSDSLLAKVSRYTVFTSNKVHVVHKRLL